MEFSSNEENKNKMKKILKLIDDANNTVTDIKNIFENGDKIKEEYKNYREQWDKLMKTESDKDLPEGWERAIAKDGKTYYFNKNKGYTQWEIPLSETASDEEAASKKVQTQWFSFNGIMSIFKDAKIKDDDNFTREEKSNVLALFKAILDFYKKDDGKQKEFKNLKEYVDGSKEEEEEEEDYDEISEKGKSKVIYNKGYRCYRVTDGKKGSVNVRLMGPCNTTKDATVTPSRRRPAPQISYSDESEEESEEEGEEGEGEEGEGEGEEGEKKERRKKRRSKKKKKKKKKKKGDDEEEDEAPPIPPRKDKLVPESGSGYEVDSASETEQAFGGRKRKSRKLRRKSKRKLIRKSKRKLRRKSRRKNRKSRRKSIKR